MSALETIQLILSFGMFTIALIKLIVDLLKNDKKLVPPKEKVSFNY
ncbi:hypothetical protein P791_2132 [Enterococcus faecalis NY9]|nr:hypothetical protein P791_2132 [Enterococcus faecalis NY9]